MSEPALTATEWERLMFSTAVPRPDPNSDRFAMHGRVTEDGDGELSVVDHTLTGVGILPESRQALAALALYGQPFRFTREDVVCMRFMANRERSADEVGEPGAHAEYGDELDSIADRIEALLPPEETAVDRELAVDRSVAVTKNASEVAPAFTNDHAAFLHRLWQHQTDPKILAGLDEIIGLIDALLPSTTSRP